MNGKNSGVNAVEPGKAELTALERNNSGVNGVEREKSES